MRQQFRGFLAIAVIIAVTGCQQTEEGMEEAGYDEMDVTTASYNGFDDLDLVDINPVDFEKGAASVSISSSSTSGTQLLIVSAASTTSSTYTLQLADSSLSALSSSLPALNLESAEEPEESQFHQLLGEAAGLMAESGDVIHRSSLASLTTTPKVGSEETFKVLTSITSLAKYREVNATLKEMTDDLLFYVDEDAEGQIEESDISDLASKFQDLILPLDRSLFGRESDVNSDGHITILMSCRINQISASGGIVTGFFFPGDLYGSSGNNPASNEQEIFYTLCPDPEGKFGVPISSDFALNNILPGVLAHELQHMISFNRHVLAGGGRVEEPWLNEALSHLAEDLSGFGLENYSRFRLFLSSPSTTSLIPATSPTLAERGAGFSFLRYLYEQHPDGDSFLRTLLTGTETGVENVVKGYGGSDSGFDEFGEFLNRWSIALAVTDTGITNRSELTYRPRTRDSLTGNPTGICLRCTADDGRGTVLSGPAMVDVESFPLVTSVSAGASQFFVIKEAPAGIAIQSAGSPTLTGTLLRLN